MRYYKDKDTNEVYAYESDQERQEWGAPDLVEMTQKEVDAHLNPPISKEQLIAEAESQKQRLISKASEEIAPLQDAVDLSMATDEEEASLKEWKKYRVLLNRVDTSTAPDIDWPEKPDK